MRICGKMKGSEYKKLSIQERDHFMRCETCGEWFDMRNLEEVIEHEHGSQMGEELAAIALERNIVRGEPIGRKEKIQ